MLLSVSVRIVLDYRPALRARTGVGEFVHELARALAATPPPGGGEELALLTSSWRDRPAADVAADLPGVGVIDRRIPVRALTWSWHRLGWPPVEWLAGRCDVVHAQSPLLVPAARAARVITIHDLDFLHHPERAVAEMRHDFPRLVRQHAARADHVVVSSHATAAAVGHELGVARDRMSICAPGAPPWAADVARARAARSPGSLVLFVGTVEPRKNIGGLLAAFARLRQRRPEAGPLVLAGRLTEFAGPWRDRAAQPDLAAHVQLRGYVSDEDRRALYRDARLLILPSYNEGFGLPVLEAMACGVPVVISNRGSLPEVAGAAARPVDPEDIEALAGEMDRLFDPAAAAEARTRGLAQAARFSWTACAHATRAAYRAAVAHRARRAA